MKKKKVEKSLCESCSNKVVIKYIANEKPRDKTDCIYGFTVYVSKNGNYFETEITNTIVSECSFFNKTMCQLQNRKKKEENEDFDDYGTDSKGNRMYGVTFTNIPGALLP